MELTSAEHPLKPEDQVPSSVESAASRSLWYFAWKRLIRHRGAVAGGVLLSAIIILALVGIWAGADYNTMESAARLPPSSSHWLGTDDLGREIAARLAYGAHLTLGTGISVVVLAMLFGVPLGLASAYIGGRFDNWSMRVMDMVLAFPSILLAMAVVAALGFGLRMVILAVAIVYIPKFARVARASALAERNLDYVRAAQALGCRPARILFVHLLPNCLAPIIVLSTLSLATAVLEAAALSFLGLGAQPPLPEWGRMLNDGRAAFQTHPHMMLAPGIALALTVLSVNLVGDGLRDAFDVRLGK